MMQTMKRQLILIAGFAIGVLAAYPAMATVVVVDPLEVMAQQSEVVIHGVVYGQEVQQDENGRIITLTQVEVVDGIKGATQRRARDGLSGGRHHQRY